MSTEKTYGEDTPNHNVAAVGLHEVFMSAWGY